MGYFGTSRTKDDIRANNLPQRRRNIRTRSVIRGACSPSGLLRALVGQLLLQGA